MSNYDPNPPRGCGTKKENSFYLEGGEMRPGGTLHAFTWCLGDGLDDVAPIAVPPRVVSVCNPAASIVEGTLVKNPYEPAVWSSDLYEQLQTAVPTHGVGDHVGSNNYSAYTFARETQWHGPSRRVPEAVAAAQALYIYEHGPIPVLFTHSRIPVFRSEAEMEEAMGWACDLYNTDFAQYRVGEASWRRDNWGLWARKGQNTGDDHYLIPILQVISTMDITWRSRSDMKIWQEARDFFETLRYVEQAFGLSWITRVTYTLPQDEAQRSEIVKEMPELFNVIDLKEKA